MTIIKLLSDAVEKGILRNLDMQFAMMVADNNPAVMLAAAILSKYVGEGNICLPLFCLARAQNKSGLLQNCFALLGEIDWEKTLLQSSAVGENSTDQTPLILSKKRLYLNRIWHSELLVTNFFSKSNYSLPYNKNLLKQTLNKLFGEDEFSTNWQKVAAAVSLTRRISVIAGRSRTKRINTVVKLLTALIQMSREQKHQIQIVALTEKTASHLTQILKNTLQIPPISEAERKYFPTKVNTLHNLLNIQNVKHYFHYFYVEHLLDLDILVVDEAFMIDLNMMSHLISILSSHTIVIFLGDHNQLFIKQKSILNSIYADVDEGYTINRAHELSEITGGSLKRSYSETFSTFRDSFCFLKEDDYSPQDSDVNRLLKAMNREDYHMIQVLFNGSSNDIRKKVLHTDSDYIKMLEEILEGYRYFLHSIQQKRDPDEILTTFNKFQLLCTLRVGPFGMATLNKQIEHTLLKTHNINRKSYLSCIHWYEGKPIVLSSNNIALGLFDGDIGVTLNYKQRLRVWFQKPNGKLKSFQINHLPNHNTAWAMTVHQSQSFKFDHVALVLPEKNRSALMTRKLVYTAATCSRKSFSIYVNDERVLERAFMRNNQYYTKI